MSVSRILFSITVLVLVVSGILLFVLAPASDMDLPHAWNGALRQWHGYGAMLSLILFGYFIKDHVEKKWRKLGRYPDAIAHLICWCGLMITALWLYYPIPSWPVSFTVADIHTVLGLALILVLPLHSARFWWR